MNIWDILILLVIAIAVGFAIRTIRKNRGSCSCGCSGCTGSCSSCSSAGICKKHKE